MILVRVFVLWFFLVYVFLKTFFYRFSQLTNFAFIKLISVPGEPRNIQLTAINSTTIKVNWKPPFNKEQNGIIRGYQIHLQELNKEGDLVNEPIKYDVANGDAEEYNVTDLQPDTEYSIQVAAVTRKGNFE